MTKFKIDSIKQLKGAPLAVLFLLFFCSEPVSQAWLERWSGYSNKTTAQACHFLKECGLIVYTQDGWLLVDQIDLPCHPRRNSIPIININDSDSIDLQGEGTNTKGCNFSTPPEEENKPPNATLPPESPEKQEMWRILQEAGVHRNDRTRDLLKQPHMTPDYLRAKLEDYRARGQVTPAWIGLVILALEAHEPPDPRAENGHLLSCECPKCAVRRFKSRR